MPTNTNVVSATPYTASKQRLINISCFIIWVAYALIQTALLWWFEVDFNLALNDSLISATVLTLCCYAIASALNHYSPRRKGYFYIVVWGLVLAGISISADRWILQYVLNDKTYLDRLDVSLPLRFFINALLIAWIAVINILWNIQQEYKENEQRKADAERLAREAELYNLRQQLQPHFLFNSLNSIIALIGRKPDEARNMTFQLSDFLRGTLRKDDQQLIALKDELEHLQLYLEIEKVRFGHRLETQVDYDEECLNMTLPAMIMQPLVENAIKYGLYDTTDKVTISIACTCSDHLLEIQIENPYDSQSNKIKRGTGFGLRGVQRRLYLLFGRTDLLETKATTHIFTSIIKIPQL
ncbi:histidine kinase [Parapedobacter sp. ISTM3]|uniref:Histidine kinase n=1 Tax=Parapedobacter luteus TaxID=623280 RepID=A0A1T5AK50_9SPHI|nr:MULTISPECIES: histidine kinase [Parapedobacter]MBK1441725.1 histidine kinase [Parapedobacter sp. ISTM3]SKB35384.1 Histidine kinase [Parapedobacter luteus]